MMTFGILLLLLTGLCWVGIGAVVSFAAERERNLDFIQFGSSGLLGLIAAAVWYFQSPMQGSMAEKLLLIIPVFLAGCGNFIMLSLAKKAMKSGNNGAVWGIIQSALVCPFVMGMVFFHVPPTFCRFAGIALILTGLFLFSRTKPGNAAAGTKWLLPTFLAFAAAGLAQCLGNLPSYFSSANMSTVMRCMLVQAGTVSAFLVNAATRKSGRQNTAGTLYPILLLTAAQMLTLFFFFYRGLNLVAEAGCGSIGYPIAQGSNIAFFLLYEKFVCKKPCPVLSWIALAVLSAGILIIAL